MKIYLDFDGTVVEHQYPLIGRCNEGCLEIIDKLNKAGHKIVINTMRVEYDNRLLKEAIEFINHSLTNLKNNKQIYSFENTDHKYDPTKWDWDLHFNTGRIFIDDVCDGIPLKKGVQSSRDIVDWDVLNLEFIEHGLYLGRQNVIQHYETDNMINSTSQLNEIVKNISKVNTNNSVGQLISIIEICKQSGIKFSFDEKYNDILLVFIQRNFPDFNLGKANQEIDYLARENKYHEATKLRDEINALNSTIHKQFRMEKYKTEDWFISRSENEIFFLPTQIAVIDNLIFGN